MADRLSPFVTTRPVDTVHTGMDTPTDCPRRENNHDPLLTEKDTCAYLRVSKRNPICWRMAGLIPYFKIGRPSGSGNRNWTPHWSGYGLVAIIEKIIGFT